MITSNGTVIAELDNIEEIRVNSEATDGDTDNVVGSFGDGLNLPKGLTSLLFNTIHFNGTSANDTVDISGPQSDHRIVFTANGGTDTVMGSVRTQDDIDGAVNDLRNAEATTFGAQNGLDAMVGGSVQAAMIGGSSDGEMSRGRTMIEMGVIVSLDAFREVRLGAADVNFPHLNLDGLDHRAQLQSSARENLRQSGPHCTVAGRLHSDSDRPEWSRRATAATIMSAGQSLCWFGRQARLLLSIEEEARIGMQGGLFRIPMLDRFIRSTKFATQSSFPYHT